MLSSVSWSDYFAIVGIAALLYYTAILLIYFRKDIVPAIQKYRVRSSFLSSGETAQDPSYLELLIGQNMKVCDHLREYLQKAASEKTGKETCVNDLKQILNQYPMLHDTAFAGTISNLILTESNRNNITFLPVEEVDALWVKAG